MSHKQFNSSPNNNHNNTLKTRASPAMQSFLNKAVTVIVVIIKRIILAKVKTNQTWSAGIVHISNRNLSNNHCNATTKI